MTATNRWPHFFSVKTSSLGSIEQRLLMKTFSWSDWMISLTSWWRLQSGCRRSGMKRFKLSWALRSKWSILVPGCMRFPTEIKVGRWVWLLFGIIRSEKLKSRATERFGKPSFTTRTKWHSCSSIASIFMSSHSETIMSRFWTLVNSGELSMKKIRSVEMKKSRQLPKK